MAEPSLEDHPHPLALEIQSLRAAVARFQDEAHTSTIKLQHYSFDAVRAHERAVHLERENDALRSEVAVLRDHPSPQMNGSLASSSSSSTEPQNHNQIEELTLSLRRLSQKLTLTEEALLTANTSLAESQAQSLKASANADNAYELGARVRSREEEALIKVREGEWMIKKLEEELRMSDGVVREYANLVREMEVVRSPSSDSDAHGQEPTQHNLEDSLKEGKAGLERLFAELQGECDASERKFHQKQAELDVCMAQLEAEKKVREGLEKELGGTRTELEKLKLEDGTAAKMVSRYMQFSQTATNKLLSTLSTLRTRHASTLSTLSSKNHLLSSRILALEHQNARLLSTVDELGGEVMKEAFGRRREVAMRIRMGGREERVVEGLRRWIRRGDEMLSRLHAESPSFSSSFEEPMHESPSPSPEQIMDTLHEMTQQARILLDNLSNGLLDESTALSISGGRARETLVRLSIDGLLEELGRETERRVALEKEKIVVGRGQEDDAPPRVPEKVYSPSVAREKELPTPFPDDKSASTEYPADLGRPSNSEPDAMQIPTITSDPDVPDVESKDAQEKTTPISVNLPQLPFSSHSPSSREDTINEPIQTESHDSDLEEAHQPQIEAPIESTPIREGNDDEKILSSHTENQTIDTQPTDDVNVIAATTAVEELAAPTQVDGHTPTTSDNERLSSGEVVTASDAAIILTPPLSASSSSSLELSANPSHSEVQAQVQVIQIEEAPVPPSLVHDVATLSSISASRSTSPSADASASSDPNANTSPTTDATSEMESPSIPTNGATNESTTTLEPISTPMPIASTVSIQVVPVNGAEKGEPGLGPKPHPMIAELLKINKRYDDLQRAFRDCHYALEALKAGLGSGPGTSSSLFTHSSSSMYGSASTPTTSLVSPPPTDKQGRSIPAEILRAALGRLDDFTEDARVELEIRVGDEALLAKGYETMLSVPGALASGSGSSSKSTSESALARRRKQAGDGGNGEEPDEENMDDIDVPRQSEVEKLIEAFVDGSDPAVKKAREGFMKKLEDVQHDIAVLKRAIHNPESFSSLEVPELSLDPAEYASSLSLPTSQHEHATNGHANGTSANGVGNGWTSWIRSAGSPSPSSRSTTPAHASGPSPTFGSIMTSPRLRHSTSNQSIQQSNASSYRTRKGSFFGFGRMTEETKDPLVALGLKVPMPHFGFALGGGGGGGGNHSHGGGIGVPPSATAHTTLFPSSPGGYGYGFLSPTSPLGSAGRQRTVSTTATMYSLGMGIGAQSPGVGVGKPGGMAMGMARSVSMGAGLASGFPSGHNQRVQPAQNINQNGNGNDEKSVDEEEETEDEEGTDDDTDVE